MLGGINRDSFYKNVRFSIGKKNLSIDSTNIYIHIYIYKTTTWTL